MDHARTHRRAAKGYGGEEATSPAPVPRQKQIVTSWRLRLRRRSVPACRYQTLPSTFWKRHLCLRARASTNRDIPIKVNTRSRRNAKQIDQREALGFRGTIFRSGDEGRWTEITD